MKRVLHFCLPLLLLLGSCKEDDPRTWEYRFKAYEHEAYSEVHLPVKIKREALESLINKKLDKNLLEHAVIKNEHLATDSLSLYKSGDLSLNLKSDRCFIRVPVNFHLSGDFIFKILGAEVRQQASFDVSAEISIQSKVWIDSDYSIAAHSVLEDIRWIENPVFKLGVFKLSIPDILEKKLHELAPEIMAKFDREVLPSIDIKKAIQEVWGKVQSEKIIPTEYGNIYFQLLPDSLGLSAINGNSKNLELYLSFWTDMEFSLKPMQNEVRVLPPLKSLKKVGRGFDIDLVLFLSYQELNEKARELLFNESFTIEGQRILIKDIELFGAGEHIGLFVQIAGDFEGDFYLKGIPHFEDSAQMASFDNLEILMNNEDISLSLGSYVFYDEVIELLEEKLNFPMEEVFNQLPNLVSSAVGKKDNYEKVQLHIEHFELHPKSPVVSKEGLIVPLKSNGAAFIAVKQLGKE